MALEVGKAQPETALHKNASHRVGPAAIACLATQTSGNLAVDFAGTRRAVPCHPQRDHGHIA